MKVTNFSRFIAFLATITLPLSLLSMETFYRNNAQTWSPGTDYYTENHNWQDSLSTNADPNRNTSSNSKTATEAQLAKEFEGITLDECAICMESFTNDSMITKVPCSCKITYHEKCISDWAAGHSTCPQCRTHIGSHVPKGIKFSAVSGARIKTEQAKNAASSKPLPTIPQPIVPKVPQASSQSAPKQPSQPSSGTFPKATKQEIPPKSASRPSAQPSSHEAPQRPAASAPLTAADFRGIDLQCELCKEEFSNYELITKLPCACRYAYHPRCLRDNHFVFSNSHNAYCPRCPRNFGNYDLPSVMLGQIKFNPNRYTGDTKNNPDYLNSIPPLRSQNIISDALAAFIYGITAEHMWSKQDFSKTKRAAGLGILGLSLIPLHASLYRQNPHHIPHRTCAWLIGSLLGFLTPQLLKKTAPATCPPQPSK